MVGLWRDGFAPPLCPIRSPPHDKVPHRLRVFELCAAGEEHVVLGGVAGHALAADVHAPEDEVVSTRVCGRLCRAVTTAPFEYPNDALRYFERAQQQIAQMHSREQAFAELVRQDLLAHAGYYPAAVARAEELCRQHHDRPHWRWASERWTQIFEAGGLQAVLTMLADPDTHQELLSASPFALMRPPGPENDYYRMRADA
jgi:hypothetical protein